MHEPIRVLHYGMSPSIGGIETFIMNIYRKINRNKIQFDFLTFSDKIAFEDEIKTLGGKIFRLTSRRENFLENYRQINGFFKKHEEYRTIHYHITTCSYIAPLIAASKCERNIIVHSHSNYTGTDLLVKLFHKLNQPKVIKLSKYMFACSQEAGEYMFGKKNLISKKYVLIKNAIDAEVYRYNPKVRRKIRNILNINDNYVVGHVGRFSPPKNHEFLLDIFYEVYKYNKDAVLLLVGSGELEGDIRRKINSLGLRNNVKMLGERRDVHEIMQAMDIFLFPSLYEGFGIAPLEAQAAGLKTIVSDKVPIEVKVITDLLESIPLSKPAIFWANRVLSFMNGYSRKDTYEEIVRSGYDIKEIIKMLEMLYLNAVTGL